MILVTFFPISKQWCDCQVGWNITLENTWMPSRDLLRSQKLEGTSPNKLFNITQMLYTNTMVKYATQYRICYWKWAVNWILFDTLHPSNHWHQHAAQKASMCKTSIPLSSAANILVLFILKLTYTEKNTFYLPEWWFKCLNIQCS